MHCARNSTYYKVRNVYFYDRRPALLTNEPPSDPTPPSVIDLQSPLAEVMRPMSVNGYVGQENIVGRNALLRNILDTGQVPSLIFWGPPGCGKVKHKIHHKPKFVTLN